MSLAQSQKEQSQVSPTKMKPPLTGTAEKSPRMKVVRSPSEASPKEAMKDGNDDGGLLQPLELDEVRSQGKCAARSSQREHTPPKLTPQDEKTQSE